MTQKENGAQEADQSLALMSETGNFFMRVVCCGSISYSASAFPLFNQSKLVKSSPIAKIWLQLNTRPENQRNL
jgi:hypothetical protein